MRVKLTVEYDGTPFAGWQKQPNIVSVQEVIETSLLKLFGAPIDVLVAGRTDAGVHALGQVCHCDIEDSKGLTPYSLPKAINAHFGDYPVAVLAAEEVTSDFHARFSAQNKLYRYVILNRHPKPVLTAGRAWHMPRALDAARMHEAAQGLLGRHDFTSFRDSECQAKTPMRKLDRLDVIRDGDYVLIETEAKSFLHHQVRNMTGTLVQVGLGKQPASWPAGVLAARDRRLAGQTAPPQGLYLARIDY